MAVVTPTDKLLSITENGFGKISMVRDYRKTHRGSKGVVTIKMTDRNGHVVSAKPISDDNQLIITTQQGMVIRVPASEIRTMGRSTQGVKIMNLSEDDKVTAAARLIGTEDEAMVAELESHEDLSFMPVDNSDEE